MSEEYPRLPDGWPTDADSLTHADLDDYDIQRGPEKRPLSLKDRQGIYRYKYLLGDDERKKKNRNTWIGFGAFGAVVIGIVVAIAVGSSGTTASDDYAVAACQTAAEAKLKDPGSASFDLGPTLGRDSDGNVATVAGTGHGANSFGGTVPFTYTCDVTLDDDTYRVTNAQVTE
ncbi:hypothetical protein [Cumulibacter soli]|uniref:hypothetical protein n=1 Tax=Cumulibacter soli TaxID=2546344 RepID=UPI001067ACBF|nr:hypothetical protein [Cumulibacter soli]